MLFNINSVEKVFKKWSHLREKAKIVPERSLVSRSGQGGEKKYEGRTETHSPKSIAAPPVRTKTNLVPEQ